MQRKINIKIPAPTPQPPQGGGWTDGNAHSRLFSPQPDNILSPSRIRKDELRARLKADIEAYLAAGGKIQQVPGFESTHSKPLKPSMGFSLSQSGA